MEKNKVVFVIFFILFGLNVSAYSAVYQIRQVEGLEIVFFDIGQGDSALIETSQGHQILVDGGPGSEILEKLADEMPFWDKEIDLVILTHTEHDHIAGLLEVLKRYKVDYILWTGAINNTLEYKEWLDLIGKEGALVKIAQAGQRIKVGKGYLEILHPFENLEGINVKDINDTSVVFRLVFKDISFLFTGDIGKPVEKELIEKNDLDSDVLKVGHHGSKTSSSLEFIQSVSPSAAVISCGKNNRYGHPHEDVLQILESCDISILRTDQNGYIKIFSDGSSFNVEPQTL